MTGEHYALDSPQIQLMLYRDSCILESEIRTKNVELRKWNIIFQLLAAGRDLDTKPISAEMDHETTNAILKAYGTELTSKVSKVSDEDKTAYLAKVGTLGAFNSLQDIVTAVKNIGR